MIEAVEPGRPPPTGPRGLPYFGYAIFSRVPSGFEPTAVGPVDPEYLIGPEDILRVTVWGQVEFQNELVVDREGKIFIPTIGQFLLSGLTLERTYQKLLKQMSRSYSGLISQPPTVWMDVTLARLRPKRIFIMGEVTNPGGYTVSSYATIFSSLYSVGGPKVSGSLREVRVIRGNKTVARVDLYDYLTGSERTNDIRVQNNDIIFVPVRGKTVGITKEVRRPAIYELLPGENLRRLLALAGDALSTAYLERIQVDRIVPFEERATGEFERRVVDVNFREILNAGNDYELVDGDFITVYSIFDERLNVVTITGAVWRPGQYQLEKAPTVKSLVAAAEGLLPKVYAEEAHLIRFNADRITTRIIPIDLRKLLNDSEPDLKLLSRDEIIIYSSEATEVKNKYVTIRGQVKSSGKYPLPSNMTLEDLVLHAGGYTEEAELLEAEVSRIMPGGLKKDSLAIILRPALPTKFSANPRSLQGDTMSVQSLRAQGYFVLQHRDEVFIRPNPHYSVQQNVTIEGDIMYPGTYAIQRKGERLSELLARAGGPTMTSYLGGGEFYRAGQRLLLNFTKAYYEKGQENDVVMFGGDSIVIPSEPHTVLVEGEVNKPGLLSFIEGDAVSDYIDRAGGETDSVDYALLIKPTGETKRVNFGLFRADPEVPEGSTIQVLKVPPPPPEVEGETIATTIKDIFAIVTGAATIAFIIHETTK